MDTSCRIVVVSSSLQKAGSLVEKLKLLGNEASEESSDPPAVHQQQTGLNLLEPVFHQWSISNRYYTANVHFALHTLTRIYPAVLEGVPALIVTWTKGEPFEEYLKDVSKAMEEHEPEVLLAVRLPHDSGSDTPQEDAETDDNAIDSTVLSYGFEYIDASPPFNSSGKAKPSEDEPETLHGIPRLPRVLDALGTIMWPSMAANSDFIAHASASPNPRTQQRSQSTLDHIVNPDRLAILQALEELDAEFDFDTYPLEYHDAVKHHLSLSSSDSDSNWTLSSSSTALSTDDFFVTSSSPTDMTFDGDTSKPFGILPGPEYGLSSKPRVSLGFEDDFTAFVSPPEDEVNLIGDDFSHLQIDSGRTTPDYKMLHSADQADFPHAGPLYRSLGSVSDLGDVEES